MNARKRTAVIALAAGALGLGVVAVAVPAVAGMGPFGEPPASAPGPGHGPGWGAGSGMENRDPAGAGRDGSCRGGAIGERARDGGCGSGCQLPAPGDLTAQERSTLAAMAAEEKLAHDLYTAFADQYDVAIFERIAASETRHLAMVRTLLARYDVADPTAGLADGDFGDAALQVTYDRLLAQGRVDLASALQVGRTVEQADIDELRAALEGLTAPDVTHVYQNLLRASQQHLAAFDRLTPERSRHRATTAPSRPSRGLRPTAASDAFRAPRRPADGCS